MILLNVLEGRPACRLFMVQTETITHVACGGILDGRLVGAAVWGLSRAGDLLSESCVVVTQISSSAMDVAWGRSCGFGARQAWGAVQTCTWLTLPTIPPANRSRKLGRHAIGAAVPAALQSTVSGKFKSTLTDKSCIQA